MAYDPGIDAGDKSKGGNQIDTATRRKRKTPAQWGRASAFVLLFILLAFSGAMASVCILGRSVYRWHGFVVELRLLPATVGQTRLVLTPLGEVRARTHAAPVALIAALEEIQVEEIKKLLAKTPRPDDLAQDFERTARADLQDFVLRQALLAGLGALAAPLLLRCRRGRAYAVGGLMGMAGMALVLGSALTTFNGKAFETPTYTGTLKQAPWVIQFGKDAFTKIEALSQKLRAVASNLNVLYGRIAALPGQPISADGPNTFRILHVSDLHNNPAGLDFLHEVADQFKVAFIVDTGDLTDFGSPPETVMVQRIARLPYPYVFVLGNHDSRTVADALSRVPNVTLLNGQVVTVKGVTLLGLPNPASARAGVGSVDTTPAELQAGGETLLRIVAGLPTPPDILAIHDPDEARPLWGRVPLILCGHKHAYSVRTVGDPAASPSGMATVECNAGTTGAAGLRYFDQEQGVPFSCAVLTFQRPPAPAAPATPAAAAPPISPGAASPPGPPTIAPANPGKPSVMPRPRLLSIDIVALNGSLGEYSIMHYSFGSPTSDTPPVPARPGE